MDHTHLLKKATKFAQESFERIQKEGLMPTPETYELWFVYYSEANPEVTRAVDILVARKQPITDQQCHDIHQRFLSEHNESEHVREAGEKIQETIKDVGSMMNNAKTAATKYNTSLSTVKSRLTSNIDQEQLKAVLHEVKSSTDDMLVQNQVLEQKLTESIQAVVEMKQDLEIARREALTDSLTRVANRKAFDDEVQRLIHGVTAGEAKPFSLVLMDIDYFKSFNDTFGHQIGDQVLKLVARTFVDGVKGRDMVSRYGGEEFCILLPETNITFGIKVADNLRTAVAVKEIVNRNTGEKLAKITISGGVAEYKPGESLEDFIERADHALYAAKHNGRNQVAAAVDPDQQKLA